MAETWSKSVFSSNLSTVAYDAETGDLFVTFQSNGAKYVYRRVPEELAEQLANAPSAGSMLRNEIAPYYSYSRV